jgi:hypothetical protein
MFGELIEWMMTLDREFLFLLALPFVVAVAGLTVEASRTKLKRANSDPQSRETPLGQIGRARMPGV